MKKLFNWSFILPLMAWLAYFLHWADGTVLLEILTGALLIGAVLAGVHHSEVIAARVGEPYGTILLAVAITIIEVALIITLMMSGGEKALYLARDTVFSAVMLILNAIIGICILVGSAKHFEQSFQKDSVNTALVSLIAILVLTLILPNYTTSVSGPRYSEAQLVFTGIACLGIYGTFLLVQTVRHKNYFLSESQPEELQVPQHAVTPGNFHLIMSLLFLLISLGVVVLLAKAFSPAIEAAVFNAGLPNSLVGVLIAALVLLPEGMAAIIAARKNNLQSSLNLALGSALASIGLTIPAVVFVSRLLDLELILGLDTKSMILLGLSVFTVMLSLSKGKTNILYGVVLLVNLGAYIFTVIFP
jgi:Ca2+:H+ antiporter